MLLTSFAALLALSGVSNAATIKNMKRDTVSTSLYAYGSETNGAQVFYADGKYTKFPTYPSANNQTGLAYIGSGALDNATTQTNITFATDSSSTTIPWPITANSSSVTFNETQYLYIIPTNGSFEQVGFASNSSVPTNGVTTGFTWFGTSVAYAASDSDYEIMFWAANTTTAGVYALYWNAAGTPVAGSFPVVLKNYAASVLATALTSAS
jgi:hypothetical protein